VAPAPKKTRPTKAAKPKRRRAIFKDACAYPDDASPVDTFIEGLGESSQRTTRVALESLADILSAGKTPAHELAWHELGPEHTAALRSRLQKLYAPTTANRYLSALRGVLKAAWRLEYIDRDTMERVLDVGPIRGKREIKGRSLSQDELAAIFGGCFDDTNAASGARDGAILALLYGGGLRRTEVATLDVADIDLSRGSAHVIGKGDKERTVYLPAGSVALVEEWLKHRGTTEPGALFWRVGRTGKLRAHRIGAELVYQVVLKRHRLAGVDRLTPHDLRRSYISDLLDGGVDLVVAARQVGHSNVQTTARYDRRSERAQESAAAGLHVPSTLPRKAT